MTPARKTPNGDDRDLRERFETLRAVEGERAPSFSRTLAAARDTAPPRRGIARLGPLLAGAAAVAVAVWWGFGGAPSTESDTLPAWAQGGFGTPTDVLLETPGADLLRRLPSLPSPPSPRRETHRAPAAPRPEPWRTLT